MVNDGRSPLPSACVSAAVLALSVVLPACGPMEVRVPRVTSPSTGKFQYGKFVWFDLATSDVAAAKRFYGELFGWEFSDLAEGDVRYTVVQNQSRMIAGIVADPEADGDASLWIGSISVPDVDRAAEQTREAGGVVHDPPEDLKDRGRTAFVTDPQGADVAFLRASGGDPPDRRPAAGDFGWVELWTSDLAGSLAFYVSLGYTAGGLQIRGDEPYRVLKVAGEPQAGVVELERGDAGSGWLPYVAVDDLAVTVEKAVALGGQVVIEPDPEFAEGLAAVIVDPTGAALAVFVHDSERSPE
jgi:predicted enzyme related to lactoylglutathione lyase